MGDAEGVLPLDGSDFPTQGTASVGVKRPYGGDLGPRAHGQAGVFWGDVSRQGDTVLDRRLYLPEDWADDPARRVKAHVPAGVTFRESWRIAVELLERCRTDLPHAWVTGDDELGRPARFRAWLRRHGERYILDVPCNTSVRDLERRRPRRRRAGRGRRREVPFCRADAWAARQPDAPAVTLAGEMATVFHEQVRSVARRSGVDNAELLGRALAHEIGHLLLRARAHSPTGLMRGVWSMEELTLNRREDWLFAPADRERLQRHAATAVAPEPNR